MTNSQVPELKQLKKNDFLAAVTEAPMTKGDLVDALENFEFIPTYLDYLIEHFEAQGKIVVGENEDGDKTIQRKGRKTSGPRNVFRVVEGVSTLDVESEQAAFPNGTYELEVKEITGNLTDEDKDAGWSMTEKAAIKKASSMVFADYKARTAAIKALLAPVTEETATEEDEEA